jgi:hypothetical protein
MSCCPPSITPDFSEGGTGGGGGGGGVESVGAGTNITISGTPTNPIVNAVAGVSAVEGVQGSVNLVGVNCSIVASGQDITFTVPTIPPSGVQTIATTGAGLSQTGTATNPILENTGVISLGTTGAGIVNTGTATAPILQNTGVIQITTPTNNGSGLSINNGGVGAIQMYVMVESGNGCVIRPSTTNASLFVDNDGITSINTSLKGDVNIASPDGSINITQEGNTLNLSSVAKEAPVQSVAGLIGAITFSSSDSSIEITPADSNIDLKVLSGGTSAPNVNTPALHSFQASNQNVVGFPQSGQVFNILFSIMASAQVPAWVCNTRFVKFDFFIPIIRTLTTTGSPYASPVNETLTFVISPSLSYTPVIADASNYTITQSTGLTTNAETNEFVLQGSILCNRQTIPETETQFFMWVNCQTDSNDPSGWISYTLKQDTTNNWCVATPVYN